MVWSYPWMWAPNVSISVSQVYAHKRSFATKGPIESDKQDDASSKYQPISVLLLGWPGSTGHIILLMWFFRNSTMDRELSSHGGNDLAMIEAMQVPNSTGTLPPH